MKPPYHAGFLGVVSKRFTLGETVLGPLPAQGLPGRWPTGPEGILAMLAVFEDGQKEKKVKDFRPTSTRRRPTWPLFPSWAIFAATAAAELVSLVVAQG
jgi:hypothetical protein